MKFLEFEDSDTGKTISVKAERVDAVYKAAQPDAAIMRIAESIVKVKGTRAEVVGKLEAFALFNERKQREAAALGLNRMEQLATAPTLSGRKWMLDPRCEECNRKTCPHPNDCNGRWDYPATKTEDSSTLPTEPGLYVYRWPTLGIVTPSPPRPNPWIPVEIVETLGHLFVIDPTAKNEPFLNTYKNAEWRKRDPK